MSCKLVSCVHRHCVFTIPEELRIFFLQDRRRLSLLFSSVRDVVLRMFAKINKAENFTPGLICVLHTFGQDLKWKGNSKSLPPLAAIKTPLRDGDIERPDDPAYANAYFINANSATAPGIVDADRNPVLTRSEVYSGVYGRASINLYAFNSNGNKGIACGLNNL